jgi:hypothetical protein
VPTTRFLFWNINRKPLADFVGQIAHARAAEVVILAECEIDAADLVRTLNQRAPGGFHYSPGANRTFSVFVRFSPQFLQPRFGSDRVSIQHLSLPARSPVLLAMAHLPSKLYWSGDSQAFESAELARQITTEEDKVGHQRTVLVGDFNMNPFEPGVVGGLNCVPTRQLAARGVRTVQGREYRMFYNPMWSHFGDATRDTAGSYFYSGAEHVNYSWHIFDQVLIRPELAQHFDPRKVEILDGVGDHSLVHDDGRPDSVAGSDHLPVIFELEF